MGEENGKAIEDVYYRQPSKGSDPTVANWVRDGDKSKSDLPVEDLKRFYKKSEPTYSVKETEPEFAADEDEAMPEEEFFADEDGVIIED